MSRREILKKLRIDANINVEAMDVKIAFTFLIVKIYRHMCDNRFFEIDRICHR